ncbi:Hint domain-containing protein [Methylosinus sp. LW4]|uniref:Hint domain-containing protein n=1 Tax=Methylosinus sp. LW4 TaxID=136993 RepID=UPI0012FC264B|nr:Hint domain-containing protein [Methylosinus sp. LW4]
MDNNIPFYCYGTKILTVCGDVAVQDLNVGDSVVTIIGKHKPIRRVSHREVDCYRHSDPTSVWPIRISAHAFRENAPVRNIYVSPSQALCFDLVGEILIPARALVNGATIAQVEVSSVIYWYVELEGHDRLPTENQPSESTPGMGNQAFFEERGAVLARLPELDDSSIAAPELSRPFYTEGPIVAAVHEQLLSRAKSLGWTLDQTPPLDLHLLVDGTRIEPVVRGWFFRFAIPPQAQQAWLISSMSRPSDVSNSDDGRNLGVCIVGLTLCDGFGSERSIDLGDPQFDQHGFHHFEEGQRRWTSGLSRIPPAYLKECTDGVFLRIELGGPMVARWTEPQQNAISISSAGDGVSLALGPGLINSE